MEDEVKQGWYNYATQEWEFRDVPTSDLDALAYMPQHPAAKPIYDLYRAGGKSITEAMRDALTKFVDASERVQAQKAETGEV